LLSDVPNEADVLRRLITGGTQSVRLALSDVVGSSLLFDTIPRRKCRRRQEP
jgi:hypothetical protein